MLKRTKKNNGVDVGQIRAALAGRYKKAFGCEWELAPWGKPWRDVLAEAQSADQEYVGAATRLTELVAAIDGITTYAESRGFDAGAPLCEDALHGRTRAEQFLLVFASSRTNEGKRLRGLRDEVAELTALLSAQPEAVFATLSESAQDRGKAVVQGTLSLVKAGLDAVGPDWEAISHARKLFATHATRAHSADASAPALQRRSASSAPGRRVRPPRSATANAPRCRVASRLPRAAPRCVPASIRLSFDDNVATHRQRDRSRQLARGRARGDQEAHSRKAEGWREGRPDRRAKGHRASSEAADVLLKTF